AEVTTENQGRVIIIPCLLAPEPPNSLLTRWPKYTSSAHSERIFVFKFIPMGFFSRLTIRTLSFTTGELMWKNGFLAIRDLEEALVTCDPDTESIRVQVRGNNPMKLLSLIQENLENVAN